MEALEKRKRDLGEAIAENRRESKKAKQKVKDAKHAEARAWKLSSFLEHAALIIYSLSDYALEPVVKFLAANGRKRHWPEKSDGELQVLVENLFLGVDVSELTALTDMLEPTDVPAMKAALVYVEEFGLVEWTRRINIQTGVALSTESVRSIWRGGVWRSLSRCGLVQSGQLLRIAPEYGLARGGGVGVSSMGGCAFKRTLPCQI